MEWAQSWGKWSVGVGAGLAEDHRASQGEPTQLQCPDGTLSPCSPPLGPSGEMGSVGLLRGRLDRLLGHGLFLCPDEFPRPWACGRARPKQGGCLPDIFSLWIHKGRQLGKLRAPTCLLAQ